jgi:hypothetical protein
MVTLYLNRVQQTNEHSVNILNDWLLKTLLTLIMFSLLIALSTSIADQLFCPFGEGLPLGNPLGLSYRIRLAQQAAESAGSLLSVVL